MRRKIVREIVLTTGANFCDGMGATWGFAAWEALSRFAWMDLLLAISLAILSLVLSMGIKFKIAYDKLS